MSDVINIQPARVPEDVPVVRQLFCEYAQSLAIDLYFQDFEAELALLPGKYANPSGRLILAWRGSQAVGCVALRRINDSTCELKRLYVRPEVRALQLGRQLAQRICTEAREAGYQRIFLDTLPTMTAAISLYASIGFMPVEPYVFNPIEGAIFLGMEF